MKHTHIVQTATRNKKWLIGALVFLLLLWLLFGALSKVADASRPGDPLYGLDQAFEGLPTLVTLSPQSRTEKNLALFNERLQEAEQLIVSNDTNVCDAGQTMMTNDQNAQDINTALNLSLVALGQTEANLIQVTNAQDKENLAAKETDRIVHHLQLLNSLSQFAPKQTKDTMIETTRQMTLSLQRALTMLPEGRRNDVMQTLPFKIDEEAMTIETAFAVCGGSNGANGTNQENGTNQGNGSQQNTGNGTGTGRTTSNGSTSTTGTRTSGGTTGTSGGSGSNGGTGTGGGSNGLHINANTDSAGNVDVNVSDQGKIDVNAQPNPNTNGGTGAEGSVNDNKVIDTNACPGAQVLGVCL